jgi:uncharacterized repeat protein (TIGR02543 family)
MATLFHGEKPEPPPVTYTVTFDANGASGTLPAPQTVETGTVITLPEKGDLAKAGSIFVGWSENPNGNGTLLSAGVSVIITKKIIFYAQWLTQYNVTFNANGASGIPPAEQIVNDGTVISLPDRGGLSKGMDIFTGWNESSSGGGITYSAGASVTVTRNMIFYAQWLDGSTPQYTVTFNANGATSGAAPASQTVYSGISITVPSHGTLAYSGKTFGGWNTQANGGGTNYVVGATFAVTSNVTLYARWQSTIQYTITYHANGANGTVPTAQTVDPGTEIILPDAGDMINTGRKFIGWCTSATGTGILYTVGATYTVTGNVTFYAQWQDLYTVTFSANGASGTPPEAQSVDPGTVITLPGENTMIYSGRMFDGWNTQSNGNGTSFVEGMSYTVNANITLYAKWINIPIDVPGTTLADKLTWLESNAESNNTYIITLNYDEGIGPKTLSYSNRSNITLRMKNTVMRTVNLSSNGVMFTIGSGVTLILDNNITLKGRSGNNNSDKNNNSLVIVNNNGTLIMNTGTKITGNTIYNTSGIGGGVSVNDGTFIMNGGEISGNTISSQHSYAYGGGVYVGRGTFTMNGGEISGNIVSDSSFSSPARGGGVYVSVGVFTMNGGEISGNTVSSSYTGSYSDYIPYGGGLYVYRGNFTKNGGTIYGLNEDGKSNTVKNSSGTLLANRGHAVYVSSNPAKKLENTAGPEVYLYFDYNSGQPVWTGGWE